MLSLEGRILWSVTQDSNGWTVVTEPVGSQAIFVSSSGGNDNNPGTQAAPVATLTRAQQLSVSGPNEILLKSGDTFVESASSNFNNWKLSGQSTQNPFLISYYGSGTRPMIYAGIEGVGFFIPSGNTVNYVDMLGLQFDANLRDPTLATVNTSFTAEVKGIEIQGTGGNILVEDCSVNYFGNGGGDNLDIEGNNGALGNITLRRDVVDNAYGFNGGKCEGLYAYNVNNISVLQSTFDHNGWNSDYLYLGAEDIGYNHDMYFGPTCTGVDVEQNVISNASYAGVMARAGGTINYNLFLNDAVGCSFGSADGVMSTPGGVSGSLIGNVVMGDHASGTIYYNNSAGAYMIGAGLAFGQGFVIANTKPGANVMVTGNLFTGDTQHAKPAITVTMATTTTNPSAAVGINDLTISGNILNGWRQGIQTDGRFVPGGTGLYALNNLNVSHNDFVNCTLQLVRHDGGFAAASESWSADRYIVSAGGLAQSNWVTLQGKNFSYATWAANYDIGATSLSVLPYSDPTRTAATYDTTLSGPGSFQDYVANAKLLSIGNYQPVYMAQAAVSYIDAGFNLTSTGPIITGGGSTSTPGVVSASSVALGLNASSIGATTYTFTVNYVDQFLLNSGKLGSTNILVTGPNGFFELATFVSAGTPTVDANSYQHTIATYRITAPNGAWAKGEDGTYAISLQPLQALDSSGSYAQDGVIGTFTADFTNPTAVTVMANLTSGFTVTYSDASGIDLTTLNSFEVQVTGPNNYSQYATLSSVTSSGNNATVVCSYTVPGPGGSWTGAAAGLYTLSMVPQTVADISGNTVASGTLGVYTLGSTGTTQTISGTVFNDANGNGVQDGRELGMMGVTVFADLAGTGMDAPNDPVTTTDPSGNYILPNMPAGRYTIVEVPPAGYGPSSPSNGQLVVNLGSSGSAGNNFGNTLGSVNTNGFGGTGSTAGSSTGSGTGSTTGAGTKTSSGGNTTSPTTTPKPSPRPTGRGDHRRWF